MPFGMRQRKQKLYNNMKKIFYSLAFGALLILAGCNGNQNKPILGTQDSAKVEADVNDSTVYGLVGEGSAMHTLQLITDEGDTLDYTINAEGMNPVMGGILVGDRMAVVGRKAYGELFADRAINLTSLIGKWTSIDKNFEIQEGGVVVSSVKAEQNPWTSWKIVNGHLVLNKDTFDIDNLGADSLDLENKEGIFTYKRVK